LIIPSWGKKIKSAKLFKDKSVVKFTENAEFGITLKIPKAKLDEIDTIVELELK
jgi:alpha-L-fucosidase